MGDAYTFNRSSLKEKFKSGEWLQAPPQDVGGTMIRPYLVADSAFALSTSLLKGYDFPPAPGHQRTFNAAVVKARRAVEIAFGHTEGQSHVLMNNFISRRCPSYLPGLILQQTLPWLLVL